VFCLTTLSILRFYSVDDMRMKVWRNVGIIMTAKRLGTRRKICPTVILCYTNSTRTDTES